ncbi:MAG: decaprenyl-phosphate phosphoribosyltransferase [Planctomycetes bacterium]|nr:decaprenyl-phosphate phosphoribosyltransferase [Planctomycetota bacterium]
MMKALIGLLRPKQWTKNLVVFAPLIFAQKFGDSALVLKTLAAFASFCLLSGGVYAFNDVLDLEKDKRHPEKKHRPLPSGRLSVPAAVLASLVATLAGLALAVSLNRETGVVALSYTALTAAYSIALKKFVVLDVLVLSVGFLLRAVAGACAIRVEVSPWLMMCTILLALFLALGKRRHELVLLAEDAGDHRASLSEYSAGLLDQMISIVASLTVTAYFLYTMSKGMKDRLGRIGAPLGPIDPQYLMGLTIPFVLYGIFRYLYLIHRKEMGGSPEKVLFLDMPLLIAVVLWIATAMGILCWAR